MTYELTVAIERSPVWKKLNEGLKEIAEQMALKGTPVSDSDYQWAREQIILKTMLDDPEVFKLVADDVWAELQKQENPNQ